MIIYTLIESAVYRHRIFGGYTDLEVAIKRAVSIVEDDDGYHSVFIGKYETDTDIDDIEEIVEVYKEWIPRWQLNKSEQNEVEIVKIKPKLEKERHNHNKQVD